MAGNLHESFYSIDAQQQCVIIFISPIRSTATLFIIAANIDVDTPQMSEPKSKWVYGFFSFTFKFFACTTITVWKIQHCNANVVMNIKFYWEPQESSFFLCVFNSFSSSTFHVCMLDRCTLPPQLLETALCRLWHTRLNIRIFYSLKLVASLITCEHIVGE